MDVCRCRTRKNATLNTVQLHTVRSNGKVKFVEVTVNSYTAFFKVDWGTEVTAVPDSFPKLPSLLNTVHNAIHGPGNEPLTGMGSFAATLW